MGEWVPNEIVICALVGSHAYGLATPESDKDYLGVYQDSLEDLLGHNLPKDTHTNTGNDKSDSEPDWTYHELQKFTRLAIKANPTILELLWLPEDLYVEVSPLGRKLIENREIFLSKTVGAAFGGYAFAQAKRLERRQGTFSSDTSKRTAKHARHCFRLLQQGAQLITTGTMMMRVDDPEELFAIGELPWEEIVEKFDDEYAKFQKLPNILPDHPNLEAINSILVEARVGHLYDEISGLQNQVTNAKDLVRTLFRMQGGHSQQFGQSAIQKRLAEG